MTTARSLTRRLLEADEDFDPEADIKRYSITQRPGIEVLPEEGHWNVYKVEVHHTDQRGFRDEIVPNQESMTKIGEIYYSDMSDAPVNHMSPKAIEIWSNNRWIGLAGWRDEDRKVFKSFDEALQFILDTVAAKSKRPVKESEDDPDEDLDVESAVKKYIEPIAVTIKNPEDFAVNPGQEFYVELSWDVEKEDYARVQPMVTFYDTERATDDEPMGQHVSRYYASDIAQRAKYNLDLYGGTRQWIVSAQCMEQVQQWLRDELEVKRGYVLKEYIYGYVYESIDPDDPELYTNLDIVNKTPDHEKIEASLRVMLRPYYDEVTIEHRPSFWSHVFKLKSAYVWIVRCKRNKSMPLPMYVRNEVINWRQEVENWFLKWAQANQVFLRKFVISGRLRKDPMFTFETYKNEHITQESAEEEEEHPEDLDVEMNIKDFTQKQGWVDRLEQALNAFHPYGVFYSCIDFQAALYVNARTYFAPEVEDFAGRLEWFVKHWLLDNRIMPVNKSTIRVARMDNETHRPEWSTIIAINMDWPGEAWREYTPPARF